MNESTSVCNNDINHEIEHLKTLLAEKDREIKRLKTELEKRNVNVDLPNTEGVQEDPSQLHKYIARYSRQLILPEIGMDGQMRLSKSSVLIVGAGGLGCPAGLYLAACGIGKLGVVDYDKVEVGNLHRQILHTEETVGRTKCQSFITTIKRLNSSVECIPHEMLLNSTNIVEVIKPYSIIVDCSDNAPTRYLLNDACVLYKKPLVSGAALRFEGHLTIYNHDDGPCYRCLFPTPPSAGMTTNCSDGGVLGIVTGVIGCLQALEVVKLCTGLPPSFNKKLMLFDGKTSEFRVMKLRARRTDCALCGESPTIRHLIDYEAFCQSSATDKAEAISLLSDEERISCNDYKNLVDNNIPHVLLDVRSKNEINICSLPDSVNIPFSELNYDENIKLLKDLIVKKGTTEHYVVCRRGNDSQKAVRLLCENVKDVTWRDIRGGLVSWHDEVDLHFPIY